MHGLDLTQFVWRIWNIQLFVQPSLIMSTQQKDTKPYTKQRSHKKRTLKCNSQFSSTFLIVSSYRDILPLQCCICMTLYKWGYIINPMWHDVHVDCTWKRKNKHKLRKSAALCILRWTCIGLCRNIIPDIFLFGSFKPWR